MADIGGGNMFFMIPMEQCGCGEHSIWDMEMGLRLCLAHNNFVISRQFV